MSTESDEPTDPSEPIDPPDVEDADDDEGPSVIFEDRPDLDAADLDAGDSRSDEAPSVDTDADSYSDGWDTDDADDDQHNVYDLADPARRRLGMEEATSAIARGALVVMPTDTVYGLAADAFDPAGVRRLLRAKGRGRSMPTPVLIGSRDTLRALAANLGSEARDLADAFWPGGLTLICRQQPSLRWDLGDSRGTVALRMPDHEAALELLVATGPLAVSSANTTGEPSATSVEQAVAMLGDSVDVYLDSGAIELGIASTIVDATGDRLRLVRRGKVTVEQLHEVVESLEAPEPG